MPVATEMLRSGKIELGTRCNAYRNLNLLKAGIVGWSIQTLVRRPGKKPSMLVTQHARCVLLSEVTFKHATPEQTQRVQEHVREVCAWLKGLYQGSVMSTDESSSSQTVDGLASKGLWKRLRCDPKKGRGDFHDDITKERIDEAEYVFVDNVGAAWYIPKETNGRD